MHKKIVSLAAPILVGIMALALGWFAHAAVPLSAQGVVLEGPMTLSQNPAAPAAPARTAAILTYQGRLTNISGTPINSPVIVTFTLYDIASTPLWTSSPTRTVTPTNGLFTVYLGDGADLALTSPVLVQSASIGVAVGGEEMTPHQPLNTVVGNSNNGAGVVGNSTSSTGVSGQSTSGAGVVGNSISNAGVAGHSYTGFGVVGTTDVISRAGVLAQGPGPLGIALEINHGGIQVRGSDTGTNTPVFIQTVVIGGGGDNICVSKNYATVVDNPLVNNNPKAMLIVTPNYGPISGAGVSPAAGTYAVFYDNANSCGFGSDKWVIYLIQGTPPLTNGSRINVLAVTP